MPGTAEIAKARDKTAVRTDAADAEPDPLLADFDLANMSTAPESCASLLPTGLQPNRFALCRLIAKRDGTRLFRNQDWRVALL